MQDFYRKIIMEELYRYVIYKESIDSLKGQLKELEEKKFSYGVAKYGPDEGKGSGDNKEEAKIINTNSKIYNLQKNIGRAEEIIKRYDDALDKLDYMDKEILISLYGHKGKRDGRLNDLIDKYHYEKSTLYRIANRALEEVSLRLYGDA